MEGIGFIGIGKMGRHMAANLLSAGHSVTVYDINPEAAAPLKEEGAQVAGTIQEVGENSNIVITMLPNSEIVESTILSESGLLNVMKPDTIIMDMSSSYVFSTKKLAEKVQQKGIRFIDAPVSGGVKGAMAGSLTIMVGGKEEDFTEMLPILKCMGKKIDLVGEIGSGHALKAINNYLSAASLYATTEAVVLLKSLGIDLNVALDLINESSGQSYSTCYKFPNFVLPRTFNSDFALDLLLKDVKMVTSIAKDIKMPVMMAALVEQIYQSASLTGNQQQDHTEVVKFLEEMTGVTVVEKEEASYGK